ncbi:MAG: HDIG domain-containing protein [Porphyromonas sp.]|nr:HDIG domain-containing protein [Porphyromonas sp.]
MTAKEFPFLVPAPIAGTKIIDPIKILQEVYDPQSELYKILLLHSIDVTRLTLELADCSSLSLDKRFLFEAAMLHDIGIFLTNAPSIECQGTEPYIRHGYLGGELLRTKGLLRHALVCERHTGSGLTHDYITQQQLPLPLQRTYLPETTEEKLICYADKFFSKTKLGQQKTAKQARNTLAKFGADSLARFDALHRLFGND